MSDDADAVPATPTTKEQYEALDLVRRGQEFFVIMGHDRQIVRLARELKRFAPRSPAPTPAKRFERRILTPEEWRLRGLRRAKLGA